MHDKEHEEWLEDRKTRRAGAKKHAHKLPATPQPEERKKPDDTDESEAVRAWVTG